MDLTDKQRRFLISNVLPFLEEKNTEGWTRMKSTSNLKQSIYNEFGIHTFIILIKTVLFDGKYDYTKQSRLNTVCELYGKRDDLIYIG